MSKERKLRRKERERVAAEAAAARAAAAERLARREARVRALTSRLPQRHSRQTGALAERRRNQVGLTFAVLAAANVLVFAFVPEWSLRALVLVVSVLAAPVVYTMLFRRA
jgi:Flp pilus assembly protein TadB